MPRATKPKALPPIEVLREYLVYDPATGVVRSRRSLSSRAVVGAEAGCLMRTAKSASDYRFIHVASYGRFLTHRIAWALFHGEEPPLYIDHINGNKADNRIANLRTATKAQYQRNTGPRRDSTSGVKGVSWFPPLGKWCARVWVDGRAIWLGTYDRFEHAVAARKRGEETYYGEFAPGAGMK